MTDLGTARATRLRHMALATSALTLFGAPAATAQQAQPAVAAQADEAAPGEEIVVTGSRIQRRDAATVGPLLTLTADDIAKSGTASPGELLQRLPSAGVSLNSNGTQGTSYGAASINLRYLGGGEGSGNRVLVLVDGHRWVDAVGQRGFRDFVDLNTIPMGMIDGVEVLKDGASAIYGADAIAGVVNIKTIRPFDGIRASGRSALTDRGDGQEYTGILNVGKQFGRASIIVSGSYYKSEPILTSARARTAVSLVPVTTPGTSPAGLFILPGLSNNAYFGTPTGFAAAAAPVTYTGTGYGAGALADNALRTAALPGDFYNTQAQGIYSTGPSERYGVYARLGYAITDAINYHIEGLYNRRTSNQLFSPVLLDIGGTAGTVRGFAIPNTQAFNPFGTANGVPAANALAFAATSAFRIRKVLTDVGNRDNRQDVETYRVAGGFDGKFALFGHRWSWDAFGSYAKNTIQSSALNGVNYDALFLGLGNPATCAAAAGCVPVNLFGPMTAAAADYIRFTTRESNYTELWNASANATGTLFALPAGEVALAVGYEYRRNKGVDRPDAFANSASAFLNPTLYTRTTAQTRTATSGSYDLHEVYGELSVPILKDSAIGKSLDVNLAARYSRYSTVGGKVTFKAGGGYRPVEGVLIRGTYAQGFRAPSILELYQGARQTSFQGTDPCNGGATANAALVGCAGVPAGYNQANFNLNGLIPGVISGNTQLKPETSDSISAGIALTPLPGLALTVDYYNIKVKDAIAAQSATQILQLCARRGGIFCDLVARDASTGAILQLLQGSQNLASIKTDGVDATLRYDFRTGFGKIGAVLDASYLGSFRTVSPDPATGATIVDNRAGKGDQPRSTYPRWKGQASLNWANDGIDAVLRGRYIGRTTDIANAVKDSRTAAITYIDAEMGFDVSGGQARFGLGVNNVFDKAPPASYANAPINYDIYTYDARGRFLYARFSVKL